MYLIEVDFFGILHDIFLSEVAMVFPAGPMVFPPWFSCEESKAPMDLAMCKTALGELYLVGSTVTPRNLTKAGETALGAEQKKCAMESPKID